jgi:hypothetical protein
MKAIDTQYKGYRFRSRTEARWAVFFDALGLRWTFEEQGYQLPLAGAENPAEMGDSIWYLPDFWLPDLGLWVEVKGGAPNKKEDAKARALALDSGKPVLLLAGSPLFPKYRHPADPAHLIYRPTRRGVGREEALLHKVLGQRESAPAYVAAFGEAMAARFEHGESPRARRLL